MLHTWLQGLWYTHSGKFYNLEIRKEIKEIQNELNKYNLFIFLEKGKSLNTLLSHQIILGKYYI